MTKVLIATEKPFAPAAIEQIKPVIEQAGYRLALLEKYSDKQQLLDAVADADALIVRSDIVDSEVVTAAKKLKIVVRAGAGYNNLDLKALSEAGVVAMNTPGQNSNAVAELALGMMVYMARGLFNGKPGTELKGKTLGIHAFGHVGRLVAHLAQGFGMDVYAFDPFLAHDDIEAHGVKAVESAEELYKKCRYISLHIPANEHTKKSIGIKLLSSMPENATLVNTARKEVINEEELLQVMQERSDFKYVSDIAPDCREVFEKQYAGRFYFTPKKMGAQTAEANINAGLAAARQIVDFIENGNIKYKVN